MKQTALCKLIDQLIPLVDRSKISDTMLQGMVEEAINEEREQITKAYVDGYMDIRSAIQYYEENYGK